MIGDPIALGIGTPSSIPVFLLVGLSPTGVVEVAPIDFCLSEAVYLIPTRRTASLTPQRETLSLTPARHTGSCCDDCE